MFCVGAGVQVVAIDAGVLRLGVEHVRIGRIDLRLEPVTAADADPVPLVDSAAAGVTRAAPRAVVLKTRADPVRPAHVGGHVVRERGAHQPDRLPPRARVVGDILSAVVAVDDLLAVLAGARRAASRIDPDGVVIDVAHALERIECLAAVGRLRRLDAGDVHRVAVVRIGANLAEVHRPRVGVGHERPGLALVGRAPNAVALRIGRLWLAAAATSATAAATATGRACLSTRRALPASGRRRWGRRRLIERRASFLVRRGFDLRVHHVRLRSADVHANAAQRAAGKPIAGHPAPRLAAVGALVNAAARAAAREAPGRPLPFIGSGPEIHRIARIHHELGGTGIWRDVERLVPRLAAVGRHEDAALRVRPVEMTHGRDPDRVRVFGMHEHARD